MSTKGTCQRSFGSRAPVCLGYLRGKRIMLPQYFHNLRNGHKTRLSTGGKRANIRQQLRSAAIWRRLCSYIMGIENKPAISFLILQNQSLSRLSAIEVSVKRVGAK